MLQTKKQNPLSISGLTYNSLLEDAYNAIKDSDSFKNNFQDFTSNSAERLVVELYAYIATQLANRLDQMGKELFVDTASPSGMSRLLKLVGAKIDFPSAASVDVQATSSSNTKPLAFTTGIDGGKDVQELNFTSSSFKSIPDTKGNTWEFVARELGSDGEYVYDYALSEEKITFTPPQQSFTLCEGKTNAMVRSILSTDVDIFTLDGPVIKNSVRIYYKTKVISKGTSDTYEIAEFKKVDNFFTTDALTAQIGTFTERNMGNGKCEICLKPYSNDTESDVGKEVLVMYRVGGGENGNVAIGAINTSERFNITGNAAAITGTGTYTIKNTSTGTGGKNELTAEEIRNSVVKEVRNTKIAVTEEDYEYLLPKYDSEIGLIKCYGEKDSETSDLAETYGYYANPIAVWLLILKENKQVYDAYMNGTSGLTDIINDISFNTFDINPRFNEKYQINKASLNILYRASELYSHFDNGVYTFPITEESALSILKSGSANITVTSSPYVESSEPNKRGVNCFQRYSTLKDPITWEELLALTSGTVGDVYLITDADVDGGVNFRWKCIQTFDGRTIPTTEILDYWEKVTSPYLYANLVSDNDDKQYIVQNGKSANFSPVYSKEESSFSGDWSSLPNDWKTGADGFSFGLTGDNIITMSINGTDVVFNSDHSEFDTAQKLCDYINAKFDASTNVLWLKKKVTGDITTLPASVSLPTVPTEANSSFTLTSNDVAKQVILSVSGITTYGDLTTALDTALPEGYKAIWVSDNDCWNLGIICANEFTYQDSAASIGANNALYVNILGNTADTWPLYSETLELDATQRKDWEDYTNTNSTFATFKNGKLVFGFEDDECSLLITATENSRAQILRKFFGLNENETDPYTKLSKRTLTVIYGENNTYLQITMTSINDQLPNKDLYINVFGGSNGKIKLGQYYENLDGSDTISSLLKRGPIKHLYSTSYIGDVFDKYGSEYKLKLSTQKVEAQTFNQLSSGQAPAQVTTSRTKNTSMPFKGEGTFLYMKVDNVDYEGGKEIALNGNTYTVASVDGYAAFDVHWFAGCETTEFVEAIVDVFDELLLATDADGDKLTIYTVSSQFYSSIDFGTTSTILLTDLFGIEDAVVNSEEGQIDVKPINYGKVSLTNNLAIGSSLNITVTDSQGGKHGEDKNISLGYSYTEFANTVASSEVKDYIVIDNNRIILKDLTNGVSATVNISWASTSEYNAWKKMFLDNSWIGDATTGKASKTITNSGQYYIDYVDSGDDEGYWFVVQNTNFFPCGDIYFHMYEDYSVDHVVESSDAGTIRTDEYIWNNLMTKKRVMLTEHIYKQPRFIPFDLSITCYLPNTRQYSKDTYESGITKFLRTQYGVYADNIGEEVLADDITLSIKEAFTDIKKVVVNYLGYDMANSATNESVLASKFNQKHILASNEIDSALVSDTSTGVASVQQKTVHGLEITLKFA